MTIQEKTAERIYEILPYKKGCILSITRCGKIPCENNEHFEPIRLADILLAIQVINSINSYKPDWVPKDIFFRQVTLKYNLSQDNLLNQSDELCEMVLGLLGNK